MMPPLTAKDVVASLGSYPVEAPLSSPAYPYRGGGPRAMLAVPSMAKHTTDEGWQLSLALEEGGYDLHGYGLTTTNVADILQDRPSVVVVQDQHEWDRSHVPAWDKGHLALAHEHFTNAHLLAERHDIFRVTIVKDTHRQYESAKRYSQGIGCHAWIVYYSPEIAVRTLSWLRPQHLIRTYHTVDGALVPPYRGADRSSCLLSGSLGKAYPLRTRLHEAKIPGVDFLKHPGYSNVGSHTPAYLKTLSKYKVAICTASRFGYALRKHVEATACGCRVITDLPVDDVLPEIDANLIRVHPNEDPGVLAQVIRDAVEGYSPAFQADMAARAVARYDYRYEGQRLAAEIEKLRSNYL